MNERSLGAPPPKAGLLRRMPSDVVGSEAGAEGAGFVDEARRAPYDSGMCEGVFLDKFFRRMHESPSFSTYRLPACRLQAARALAADGVSQSASQRVSE